MSCPGDKVRLISLEFTITATMNKGMIHLVTFSGIRGGYQYSRNDKLGSNCPVIYSEADSPVSQLLFNRDGATCVSCRGLRGGGARGVQCRGREGRNATGASCSA